MTEDEAKNTRCCGLDCGVLNEHGVRVCRGPSCIYWRWSEEKYDVINNQKFSDGYCGLDGK